MKKLVIAFCLLSSVAFAQQPLQEYNLKLLSTEIDVIGEALAELPLKKSLPVFQKIQRQVIDQQTAAAQAQQPKVEPKTNE